jgi:hypothetical protein
MRKGEFARTRGYADKWNSPMRSERLSRCLMTSIDVAPTRSGATLVRLLWLSTLVLVLISVAMVTRRALELFGIVPASSALSNSAPLDDAFARHASLTMVHILPGLIFVVLGPLQFVSTLRSRRPRLHR